MANYVVRAVLQRVVEADADVLVEASNLSSAKAVAKAYMEERITKGGDEFHEVLDALTWEPSTDEVHLVKGMSSVLRTEHMYVDFDATKPEE